MMPNKRVKLTISGGLLLPPLAAYARRWATKRRAWLGVGQAMTVGVLETDYRVTGEGGRLDIGATVARLREAEMVLDEAAANVA